MSQIKTIILAGSRDFGRCPIGSHLPAALWPVLGKSVLERLLQNLSRHGIEHAVICSNGDTALLQKNITFPDFMQVTFLSEELPVGSAGCIRDAANGDTDALFVVLNAAMTSPPDIGKLIKAHRAGQCELTVVFEPHFDGIILSHRPAELYICDSTIVRHIPAQGYCDLKESLIPILNRSGKNIYVTKLDKPVGNFRDYAGYLAAIAEYLKNSNYPYEDSLFKKLEGSEDVWIANNAKIDPAARIYGPAILMDGSTVSEGAIIFGPAVIGCNVSVGKSSFLENCVLWDGSNIGENCYVCNSLIGYDAHVSDSSILEDKVISHNKLNYLQNPVNSILSLTNDTSSRMNTAARSIFGNIGEKTIFWTSASVLAAVFAWSYWFGLTELWNIWSKSDEYSSGMLVPFFAACVLWVRRKEISKYSVSPSVWGLFGLIFAQAVRYFGLYFMYASAERFSIVLTIASLVLLLCGWSVFRRLIPLLMFLCLMLPLPRSVHTAVMLPLQNIATRSAVFFLEIVGCTVVQEGNIINLNGTTVAVSEACNGLRMVMAFFVVTGFIVLLLRRPLWEKLVLLASSLPVALLCNMVRLTVTAIAFNMLHTERGEKMFHDLGGYAMMPLALAMVMLELWLLSRLTVAFAQSEYQ